MATSLRRERHFGQMRQEELADRAGDYPAFWRPVDRSSLAAFLAAGFLPSMCCRPMIFRSMPTAKRSKSRTARLSHKPMIRLLLKTLQSALTTTKPGAKKISGQLSEEQ